MRFGKKLVSLIMSAAMAFTFAPGIATASLAKESGPDMTATGEMAVPVYGLYNPYSGEHFFTANEDEAASLTLLGWEEGDIKWYAPVSGDPVYSTLKAIMKRATEAKLKYLNGETHVKPIM